MSKLRMYFNILGTEPYYKEVSSPEEAKNIIDAIADFVNTKVVEGVFPEHCNAAGLVEYSEEDKDWFEWYDEDGLDFDEHFEEYEEDKITKAHYPAPVKETMNENHLNDTLDEIKAEVEQLRLHKAQFLTSDNKVCIDSQDVLHIIDKYRVKPKDIEAQVTEKDDDFER